MIPSCGLTMISGTAVSVKGLPKPSDMSLFPKIISLIFSSSRFFARFLAAVSVSLWSLMKMIVILSYYSRV